MTCVKTKKSKCIVLERWAVEAQELSFEDLGFLVRALSFPGQYLEKDEFCYKYNISEAVLVEKIKFLESKGFRVMIKQKKLV